MFAHSIQVLNRFLDFQEAFKGDVIAETTIPYNFYC
jgi:hypothetical protein